MVVLSNMNKMPMPEIAKDIWQDKYRFKQWDGTPIDEDVNATFRRVANALAVVENDPAEKASEFYNILQGYEFLPAGRILTGAGTGMNVTLFNCYVMGTIPDSMAGILRAVEEAALTMQMGGGVGMDFTPIRPKNYPVMRVNAIASGPLSFMDLWDTACKTIMSAGARRGAMMGVMRCTHPDILDFVNAKRDPSRFRNFNLSVLVTDDFMRAVEIDAEWRLWHESQPEMSRTISARVLWNTILRNTYDAAEPGVIFIDRVNKMNNLAYCETIYSSNPCGEQMLPPYGACLLGSVNLAAMVQHPFQISAGINEARLRYVVRTAVRMLDNVNDISKYPLPQQEEEAKSKRRIGLGVTGVADALAMVNIRYGSDAAINRFDKWLRIIVSEAYKASSELAEEKGAFPLYHTDYLQSGFLKGLGHNLAVQIMDYIRPHGIRNSHLLSIAPTGTISQFAGNVSSGIEPIFAYEYNRKFLQQDGTKVEKRVEDFAVALFTNLYPHETLPDHFVTAQELTPAEHIAMLAVAQVYMDSSVSKTINCPEDMTFEEFGDVYQMAYNSGLKACATYRPNEITGSVLSVAKASPPSPTQEPVRGTVPFEVAGPEDLEAWRRGQGHVLVGEGLQPPGNPETPPYPSPSAPSAPSLDLPPPPRPESLEGVTYKLKWPESDHAIYITINDVLDEPLLARRPYEIFINSKNMEHYGWTLALTRMISAVFRRGGDVRFVVEELKAVFDPRGGAWMQGQYVPSIIAAIGGVIEKHMIAAHLIEPVTIATMLDDLPKGTAFRQCPKCGAASLIRSEGCDTCLSCDYSKCG